MNMITVKLADPDRKVWISTLADYLEPDATVDVPDVLFWRNEIRRGALVEVVPSDPPPPAESTAAAPTQPTAPAPPTSATAQTTTATKAKGKDKKGKGNTSKPSDPPPPADSTRGPVLGSVITKAERFGED